MVPIHHFIDGFNKGDEGLTKSAFAKTPLSIIDDVSPHLWQGPGALQAWSAALAASDAKLGNTDETLTLGKPTRTVADGDFGYVVVPAVFHFKQRGTRMRESAQMIFALSKDPISSAWGIAGWTWAGAKPQPDK